MFEKEIRPTEFASARFSDLHAWGSSDILESLLEGQLFAVAAVRTALPAIRQAVDDSLSRLSSGGRLVYIGAGTSGRIGFQDGAELTPTFNWPPDRLVLLMAGGDVALTRAVENAEDDEQRGKMDIARNDIGPLDVVIGIAASGTTPYTVAGLHEASCRQAMTIAVANNSEAPLLKVSNHQILIETGAEAIAGSTRLKAGTAQKVVLNLFSTLLMIKLGRVWRGQMVDMRATNEKLRRRAERMLKELTGAPDDAILTAMASANGNVKTAIIILSGVSSAEAMSMLERHNGLLDETLREVASSR